jgi:hypothetical protein
MSIIFQLFSAEDLQKLNEGELKNLRDEIITALKQAGVFQEPGNLHLNLREKVKIDGTSPEGLRDQQWVQEALLKRFYEVSRQLKTPPHDPSQNSFDFENLVEKRNSPDTQNTEKLILNWAISCELNHIEFYYALLAAKKGVNEFYKKYPDAKLKLLTEEQRKTKDVASQEVRTKDPDSVYSPFNPRHPLYRQYSDVSRSGPEPTEQIPPYTA